MFRTCFAKPAKTGVNAMPAYFDSSVLLSIVLGDEHATHARRLWHDEIDRVSSLLLHIECATVLRRIPDAQLSGENRRDAEERLGLALEEVTLKPVDDGIAEVVRATSGLSDCRALDAAHLATALYFRDGGDAELRVCTFDARMGDVAARLGLRVVTAET